jgi:hypothetical protein
MKKNKIVLVFLFIVFATSCKKFLDKEPKNITTDVNFWNTETEANSGVSGIYALLRTAINYPDGIGHYAWGDLPTDEFASNQPFTADYRDINQINWQISISSTAATDASRVMYRMRRWDNFYRVIDQANRVLKFVPNIPLTQYTSTNPASVQQKFLGEAYFLRAFTYFYISRIWGDVPLVLETLPDPTLGQQVPRSPANEVLDQAIKDVQEALPKLSWTTSPSSDKTVRATKGSAFALLAHIYAWKGDYSNAASAADSVILKGGYTYVPRANFTSIFKGNSSEGIFEISENKTNEGYGTGIGTRTSKSPYLLSNTGNSQMPLDVTTLYSRFFTDTVNDLRAKKGMAFLGTADPITIKYSDNSFVTYTGPNNTSPVLLHNIVVFRLADIKLLRAEALAATGNLAGARTILNEIRALAGLGASTATDTDLFEAIIDERGRELFLEGHRFYDLVRLGKKTGILKFGSGTAPRISTSEFQQGKYIWPIDPSLLIATPILTQTPYWADKM